MEDRKRGLRNLAAPIVCLLVAATQCNGVIPTATLLSSFLPFFISQAKSMRLRAALAAMTLVLFA